MASNRGTSAAPPSEAQRRAHDRVEAVFPVSVGGVEIGTTANLSPSGVLFVTDQVLAVGSRLHFSIEFQSPGGNLMLQCLGDVVRVDGRDAKRGVAIRITDSRLERARDLRAAQPSARTDTEAVVP